MPSYQYDERSLVSQAALTARPSPSGWWRAKCPVCVLRVGKPDRRGSLSIYVSEGFYTCHRCGARGRFDPTDDVRARSAAAPKAPGDAAVALRPPEHFRLLAEEPAASSVAFSAARDYLRQRRIPASLQSELHVGACARGRFAGRIIVPIMSGDGSWLGYVGRAWRSDASMPYLYPSGMRKGEIIYNHDALLVETDEPALVVEGVFDAFALWPNGVAVLGKLTTRAPHVDDECHTVNVSEAQIDALVAAKRPIAIVPDGDAWEEGEMLSWRLRDEGKRAGFVRLPPRTDPDEVPLDWLSREARDCLST